jgi:hypothetical protein
MLAHDTFDWLELATQSTANKNARGGQRGGRQQQQQRRSAPWTAQLRKKAQERHAAARHARAAQAQAAGSGAGGSVSTAAVTNEQFRLPLGARESGGWVLGNGTCCLGPAVSHEGPAGSAQAWATTRQHARGLCACRWLRRARRPRVCWHR